MENIQKNPFSFFEDLLEKDKLFELKTQFIEKFNNSSMYAIEEINRDEGVVTYWETFYDQLTDGPVEGLVRKIFIHELSEKIRLEFELSKSILEEIVFSIVSQGNKSQEYLNLQINTLKGLIIKCNLYYTNLPIIKGRITALIFFIQDKFLTERIVNIDPLSPNVINIDDYSESSFNWDSANAEDTIPMLLKLYDLLITAPAIIESNKKDFICAFSQRRVTNGICWKGLGKNGLTSKSSIFYFIDVLIEQGFIDSVPSNIISRKIGYVFRDKDGVILKNLKQSKANTSIYPSQKGRIDDILSKLFS